MLDVTLTRYQSVLEVVICGVDLCRDKGCQMLYGCARPGDACDLMNINEVVDVVFFVLASGHVLPCVLIIFLSYVNSPPTCMQKPIALVLFATRSQCYILGNCQSPSGYNKDRGAS